MARLAPWLAVCSIVAALAAVGGAASCSGKEGTCSVAPCGAVEGASFGFLCAQQPSAPPPYATYATIAHADTEGPCTSSCIYPQGVTGSCQLMEFTPTDAGTCHVQVTSSRGSVVPLTYVWTSTQVGNCAGCFELRLADAGNGPAAAEIDCTLQLDGAPGD